jgi:transcriptional regulator with XRE-family HTH domain
MIALRTPRAIEEVDVHVGTRVKSRRLQLGLTQGELADQVGITFQQLQKYESGVNRISSSRLSQIACALGVTPPYFFEDPLALVAPQEGILGAEVFNEFMASKDGIALMQAFVKIKSKPLQRKIAKLVADINLVAGFDCEAEHT